MKEQQKTPDQVSGHTKKFLLILLYQKSMQEKNQISS